MDEEEVKQLAARANASAKRHIAAVAKDIQALQQVARRCSAKAKAAGGIDYTFANSLRSRLHTAATNATQNYDRMVNELRTLHTQEQEVKE